MKYFFLFIVISHVSGIFAQKPPIDTAALKHWASAYGGELSPDGKYVFYWTPNQAKAAGARQLIVASTQTGWRMALSHVSGERFANDSKTMIYTVGGDSICVITLGGDRMNYITHAKEYNMPVKGGWLAYRSATLDKGLVLHKLSNGEERHFPSVQNYVFAPDGENVLLQVQETKEGLSVTRLDWVSLSTGQIVSVWSNANQDRSASGYTLDASSNQFAFMVEEKKEGKSVYELWYYKRGMNSAVELANDQSSGIDHGLGLVNGGLSFSGDGRRIFLSLRSTAEKPVPKPDALQMDVWSYIDTELQSIQTATMNYIPPSAAVLDIANKHIIRLEQEHETIAARSNDYVLIRHGLGTYGGFESNWNLAAQESFWLVSLGNGSRKIMRDHVINPHEGAGLSPEGKWVLFYDFASKSFFSYETATGTIRNITQGSGAIWEDPEEEHPETALAWVPWRDTWLADDAGVLVYDPYDIWWVDPSGTKPPVNLTRGYGRKHGIQFRLTEEGRGLRSFSPEKKSVLILNAVNTITKDRGYYRVKLSVPSDPELLCMGPYVYGEWDGYNTYNFPPTKAKSANVWLVTRSSSVEAPDYFVTRDFKDFKRFTHEQPQENYNWLTTELVHWKTLNGDSSAGVLYKPENFDPSKKYPLLFDYYEKRSDELNLYIRPRFSENRINIPWFVSNGYLVFIPDIHYRTGEPGKSACDAVVSAAEYLVKMPWVDASHMGIQGHSFGGYETNYIITHSNLFAAACSASGISDLISWYGADPRGGYPKYWAERDQGRMGKTPWETPQAYIDNSPIFQADKVTTPLLMMSNKDDRTVPFSQGLEFFTALRRLGKKVWMLQYDDGMHSVEGKAAADYHFRMMQFFDHYLKGMPAPKWMSKGIPARMKGVEDGLELDQK